MEYTNRVFLSLTPFALIAGGLSIGLVLLGIATLRTLRFPRWVAMGWMVSSVLIFVGVSTAQPGTANLFGLVGALILSASLVGSGLTLVSSEKQTRLASQPVDSLG